MEQEVSIAWEEMYTIGDRGFSGWRVARAKGESDWLFESGDQSL